MEIVVLVYAPRRSSRGKVVGAPRSTINFSCDDVGVKHVVAPFIVCSTLDRKYYITNTRKLSYYIVYFNYEVIHSLAGQRQARLCPTLVFKKLPPSPFSALLYHDLPSLPLPSSPAPFMLASAESSCMFPSLPA